MHNVRFRGIAFIVSHFIVLLSLPNAMVSPVIIAFTFIVQACSKSSEFLAFTHPVPFVHFFPFHSIGVLSFQVFNTLFQRVDSLCLPVINLSMPSDFIFVPYSRCFVLRDR